MIGLMITVIVLMVIVLVQFTVWTVNRDVIVRLRRDNDDKMKVILNLSETQAENVRLTKTIKMLLGANMFVSQLQDDTHHNNEALRKENVRLVGKNRDLIKKCAMLRMDLDLLHILNKDRELIDMVSQILYEETGCKL
jgi:hypothetical protein